MASVEAEYVTRRIDAHLAYQTLLLQMAISSTPNESVKPSATREAAKVLQEQLKAMINGE